MKIPLEILKVRDPDGTSRFKAIISLRDAIANTSQSGKLIGIQNEYKKLVDSSQKLLKDVQKDRSSMSDSLLRWKLADQIYSFIKQIEDNGYIFANLLEALPRDIGISKTQLSYLLKFRERYPFIHQVSKEINWSKYRELMDISEKNIRELCESLIKMGKIKSDKEIREFKRLRASSKK